MRYQHLLILLLFPFVYFDIFLTSWMRFPPHIIVLVILVIFYRKYLTPSKILIKYFLLFLLLNFIYSLFYTFDFIEFLVNSIKITTIFFTVIYFLNIDKIDGLINYSICLSFVSFLIYAIAFVDFDLNLTIRALVYGSDEGIQHWGGLTKAQFQFGYELIPVVIFLLLRNNFLKIVGLFIMVLSPQRSVISSLFVFLNLKISTVVFVILFSLVFYIFANDIVVLIQDNLEYNVLTKEQNSDSDEDSRFQMFKDGMELVFRYPFGSILQRVTWDDAVMLNSMGIFKTQTTILAPHNVIVYTFFIFGLIPGLLIFYFYLGILLEGLKFIKSRRSLKLTLFISLGLFFNAFFHNACYITSHSVTLIFYFIFISILDDVKKERKSSIFILDAK